MTDGPPSRVIGRYLLFGEIAAGGMASVRLGRLNGPSGFARTVAIKCLHPQYAKDPEFLAMFLDEARLAARIRHPNVVPTLDIVESDGETFLVMEYVQGASLARLLRAAKAANDPPEPWLVATVMSGVLHGLHAAHEATSEQGTPLGIVHRDVSPQNVLVGADGVARVLDFGVAKAEGRLQTTRDGQVKGKFAYMAPEQLNGKGVTRQSDVYSAAVVAWEALTGEKLFKADNEGAVVHAVLNHRVRAPSEVAPTLPRELDSVILRGLARDPAKRYATAREMALELERCGGTTPASELATWVDGLVHAELAERASLIAEIEHASSPSLARRPATPPDAGDREARSDVSSIAVAPLNTETPPPRTPRSRLAMVASALAVGATLLVSVTLLITRSRGTDAGAVVVDPSHTPTSAFAAAAPPPAPSAPPLVQPSDLPQADPPSMAVTDLPVAPPEGEDDTSASAGAPSRPAPSQANVARPATAAAGAARGGSSPSTATPARAAKAPASSCDPPYWIDSNGHTRYKPACL